MNERIQKLIEQATSIQGPTPYNPLTFEVFDKEKFAELIVRECADVGALGQSCTDSDLIKRGVLAHFGVE